MAEAYFSVDRHESGSQITPVYSTCPDTYAESHVAEPYAIIGYFIVSSSRCRPDFVRTIHRYDRSF